VIGALDDHLRGVDVAHAELGSVGALALGVIGAGEAVLPADVIPVIDVDRQRQQVVALGQLTEEGVGRWARRAALRGIELDHGQVFLGCGGNGLNRAGQGGRQGEGGEETFHPPNLREIPDNGQSHQSEVGRFTGL